MRHLISSGAAVAADSQRVIAVNVVQAPNDKRQLAPMLGKIPEQPNELGKVDELLADSGYFSEDNVNACAAAVIAPVIALGRIAHHHSLAERFAAVPVPPDNPTPLEAMHDRLYTKEGKAHYTLRKQTPDTGVRDHQVGAWVSPVPAARPRSDARRGSIVTMARNMMLMFALAAAS